MADVHEVVSDGVRAAEQWLSQLSAGDWVLLALGAAAIAWLVTGLRAMTHLGPIEIKPLEEDSEAKQPIKGLTAVMARRLHACGLISPSGVPAGAPQADLISAVEASPVPHANWIASILKVVPRPRPQAYVLGGTVVKEESATRAGIDVWVRPVREGREMHDFVPAGADGLQAAATCAADKAYLHIIDDTARLLPLWARWSSEAAFAAYMSAIDAMKDHRDLEAAEYLDEAASKEPTNLLVRLQYANMLERTEATASASGNHDDRRALQYARALGAYLRVAKQEPTVVEARYRASVLAAMLASCMVGRHEDYQAEIRGALAVIDLPTGSPGGDDDGHEAAKVVSALGRSESHAVLLMLRPWYTLIRQGRLPYQLEMVGMDRRRLRNTVRISRHCVWLRERPGRLRRRDKPFALGRWAVVRWLVFRGVGWHGHYNAACFDALLHQRRKGRGDVEGWLLRFLRRGALKHLNVALHDSNGALSWDWVVRDPDLSKLHDDPDWRIVKERYSGRKADLPKWEDVSERARSLAGEMSELRGRPDRPWGDPARRHYAWSVVAIGCALGVAVLVLTGMTDDTSVLTALTSVALVATVRAWFLARETWQTWSEDPDSTKDAATWRDLAFFWLSTALVLALGVLVYLIIAGNDTVWQLPVVVALVIALALVWSRIARDQAAWMGDVAKQRAAGDSERISPTRVLMAPGHDHAGA